MCDATGLQTTSGRERPSTGKPSAAGPTRQQQDGKERGFGTGQGGCARRFGPKVGHTFLRLTGGIPGHDTFGQPSGQNPGNFDRTLDFQTASQ